MTSEWLPPSESIYQLGGQLDRARAEVMGELLDARRRAEQAEAAVARVREAVTEQEAWCSARRLDPPSWTSTIRRALDGGDAS